MAPSTSPPGQHIDLNQATPELLMTVEGIGPKLARRIVAYRDEHGPFESASELVAVRGIGPSSVGELLAQGLYVGTGSSVEPVAEDAGARAPEGPKAMLTPPEHPGGELPEPASSDEVIELPGGDAEVLPTPAPEARTEPLPSETPQQAPESAEGKSEAPQSSAEDAEEDVPLHHGVAMSADVLQGRQGSAPASGAPPTSGASEPAADAASEKREPNPIVEPTEEWLMEDQEKKRSAQEQESETTEEQQSAEVSAKEPVVERPAEPGTEDEPMEAASPHAEASELDTASEPEVVDASVGPGNEAEAAAESEEKEEAKGEESADTEAEAAPEPVVAEDATEDAMAVSELPEEEKVTEGELGTESEPVVVGSTVGTPAMSIPVGAADQAEDDESTAEAKGEQEEELAPEPVVAENPTTAAMAASTAAAQDGTTTEDLGTEAEPETVSRPASDVGNPTAAASAQPHQSVSTDSPTTARANNPAAPRVDAATSPSHAAHEREAPEPVPYAAPPAERGRGFWSSLGLILLGGLLGVLLTLLVAVIWTGTIDFAPQREVDALSRNLGTVQANQELLWEQMEAVLEETGDIQGRLVAVEALGDRVGAVEADLEAAQGDLAAAQESLQTVTSELEGLRGDLGAVDERVTGAEEQIVVVEETLGGVEETLDNVETRIDSFNSFFDGLRNLLQQMDGGDATEPAPEG